VVLTPNEVTHVDESYPSTALLVVYGIDMNVDRTPSGGQIRFVRRGRLVMMG
jgi:hypothetical protein